MSGRIKYEQTIETKGREFMSRLIYATHIMNEIVVIVLNIIMFQLAYANQNHGSISSAFRREQKGVANVRIIESRFGAKGFRQISIAIVRKCVSIIRIFVGIPGPIKRCILGCLEIALNSSIARLINIAIYISRCQILTATEVKLAAIALLHVRYNLIHSVQTVFEINTYSLKPCR
jgi:hypothetical protein